MDKQKAFSSSTAAPQHILILQQSMWDWLYQGLIAYMRKEYNTRFTVLATPRSFEFYSKEVCGGKDRVLSLSEIEELSGEERLEASEVLRLASENEDKYGISYFRDMGQQIRTFSTCSLSFVPYNLLSMSKPPKWHDLVQSFNFLIKYFDEMIVNHDVDMVLTRPDISASSISVVNVAEARGIPVSYLLSSRHGDFLHWCCGAYGEGDFLRAAYRETPACDPIPREQVVTPGHAEGLWKEARDRYSLRKSLRSALVETYNHAVYKIDDFRKKRPAGPRRLYRASLKSNIYSYRTARWMDQVAESSMEKISSTPFLLFLIPQEPEFSVQSRCRQFPHVFTVIQQLAMSIPANMKLVVKEHSRLQGRRLDFYRDLLKLPNLVLAHRMLSGIELAERSRAVATMTGTSGLEATFLGKPVVLFGYHVEYDFLPNVTSVREFGSLPHVLREVVRERTKEQEEEIKACGARFRQALVRTSFSAPSSPLFGGDTRTVTQDQYEGAAITLVNNFRFQMENPRD